MLKYLNLIFLFHKMMKTCTWQYSVTCLEMMGAIAEPFRAHPATIHHHSPTVPTQTTDPPPPPSMATKTYKKALTSVRLVKRVFH